jgi:hypothetical protein
MGKCIVKCIRKNDKSQDSQEENTISDEDSNNSKYNNYNTEEFEKVI